MSRQKQASPDLFDVPTTVRKLRGVYGETQQQFSARLGIAVVTLARWETSRPPRGDWLDKLADLAEQRGLREYAETFRAGKETEAKGVGRPRRQVREKDPEYRDDRERRLS